MSRIPIDDNESNEPSEVTADDEVFQPDPEAPAAPGDVTAALKAERDDLYNRLARATADYKNSQKRQQAEFDQRAQYANQSLIKSLLPVIDNFERALAVDP